MSYVDVTGNGQNSHAQNLNQHGRRGRHLSRKEQTRRALSRAIAPVLQIEGLEGRTLLSTLPAPLITARTDISGGGDNVNRSNPSIAYNPSNPQKLVSVYTSEETDANGVQKVFIRGSYSRNGGVSWQSFNLPSNIINPAASPPLENPNPYSQATDPTVAFGLHDDFYVV